MLNKKKTIIAIVGPSGSGKTSLSMYMNEKYNVPFIASYTTRPMREGETNGIEHTFVSKAQVPDRTVMLAYTKFGDYEYWSTHDQVKDVPTTYTIDEKGLIEFKEKYADMYNIFSVYLKRDDSDVDQGRKDRDRDRTLLSDDWYDLIINNNYDTVDEFVKAASKKIMMLYGHN